MSSAPQLNRPPYVGEAVFSPDGKLVIAESGGGRYCGGYPYRIWDVETGKQLPHTPELYPQSLRFLPDSKFALSEQQRGRGVEFSLVEVATGTVIRSFPANQPEGAEYHAGHFALAISGDGTLAITGHLGFLRVWEVASGKLLRRLGKEASEASTDFMTRTVLVSHDGKVAVSATFTGAARVWDVTSGRMLRLLTGWEDQTLFALSADGKLALSGRTGGLLVEPYLLTVWDVDLGTSVRTFQGHSRMPTGGAFTPDARRFLSTGEDNSIRLWEIASGKPVWTLQTDARRWGTKAVTFSPDAKYALTGHLGASARLWDTVNGRLLRVLAHGDDGLVLPGEVP